ncbi:hypothetical protein BG006_004801, partial [Podila minutissima]
MLKASFGLNQNEDKDLCHVIRLDIPQITVRIREFRVEEDKDKVVEVVSTPFLTEETTMKLEMNLVEKRSHFLWGLFEGLYNHMINTGDALEISSTFKIHVMVMKGKLVGTPIFIVNKPPNMVHLSEDTELEWFVPQGDVWRLSFKNKEEDSTLIQ